MPPSLHEILSARRARNVCKWKEMQGSELKNECMLYELPYNGIKKNNMVASLMKLPLDAPVTFLIEHPNPKKFPVSNESYAYMKNTSSYIVMTFDTDVIV